jgi:biopolymer transport protein ExbD
MAGGSLGGGNGAKGCRRIISDINVTPLVDIMLVLLIIFMVTTTYIVRDSIDVKLPEASTGEARQVSLIAVTVDAKGQLGLNGKPAVESDIRSYIRSERRRGRGLEAVVAADKVVPHGTVVKVIDLLRREGVVKFAINVLRKED